MRIPIIALHSIEPYIQESHDVSAIAFDYLCAELRTRDFETIMFQDLLNYFDKGLPLPLKPVILTSDDGYQNIYDQAYPILQEYDFCMTVFLSTAFIGVGSTSRQNNTFDSKVVGIPTRTMLTWNEVQFMNNAGVEFLSHTVSHKRPEKFTEEEAMFELSQSKEDIEHYLGTQVSFVSWPFNTVFNNSKELLKQVGYRGAVLYRGGIEDTSTMDLNAIKRIPIMGTTDVKTYCSLIGEEDES